MPPLTAQQARASMVKDKREKLKASWDSLVQDVNERLDSTFTPEEEALITQYREQITACDTELEAFADDFEREEKAAKASAQLRTRIAAQSPGVDMDGDEIVYRTFGAYARDYLIREAPGVQDYVRQELGGEFVQNALDRLMRAQTSYRSVEHTLSSDVDGLIVPQHILQIMDVINADRPVIATANRVDLSSGSLTWPKITTRPTVRVQGTEKTETLSRKMVVSMESDSADTYLGAGNLSWQSVQWSTPAALDLFFRLLAEDYAFQTESAACHTLAKAAATISSGSLSSPPYTLEEWLTAVLGGFQAVYDATRRVPNTVYVSPDQFLLAAAVTSDSRTMMIDAGSLNLPGLSGRMFGLNVVSSRGFADGTVIVGDSRALLVGETAGAPIRLQVIEPDIAGYLVAVVGAFKAISFDDEAFADVGTAT